MLQTEYEGQVKEFFKYLEAQHVDGIVVAGGNGTLIEVRQRASLVGPGLVCLGLELRLL